ncbi:glutamate 2,3-aminomutase [Alkalicella caledoniensis]|uniref:Glutamate 2,3-aminomutase n=1 Tax=Alkalicella caledoniensis TaxID=2731377 RepID=A0A7G9WCJ4_ALKCA|nr:glutamate 2,3-aminomutase [Alkalicella caledoniensis]QNO16406.1 glutamate 2,3-aminomutase [Alkalicella caledoniensis]
MSEFEKDNRDVSLKRAAELKSRIQDYLDVKDTIPVGYKIQDEYNLQKEKLLEILGGTPEDWDNWKWQIKNRINDVNILAQIIDLTDQEVEDIKRAGAENRWAISPYYAALMSKTDPNCPVRLQSIPQLAEVLDDSGHSDPMGEKFTNPAEGITRRYPDRLIINVTNQCAMYCRHCQRRRNIGEIDKNIPKSHLQEAVDYIRANPEIRDVLITGGDSLMLADSTLDWLLGELNSIEHVEIKRLGTRALVTIPQRITQELCDILDRHAPVYLNTQFNHSKEITSEVKKATNMLAKAGVVMGNQAVLLNHINNDAHVMKKLNHELLKVRIRPYYIFHAKSVQGTSHFMTKLEDGLEIMEKLRGYTSGLAIPTYIVNAPKGYGKTPMLPNYLLEQENDHIKIRTWENREMVYKYED